MTKANEILLLDETIKAFGPHSYLGPWFKEYRDMLVADIQADLTPSAPTPYAAYREGQAILASARKEAQAIRSAAEADAKANLERVREAITQVKGRAASECARAMKVLDGEVW